MKKQDTRNKILWITWEKGGSIRSKVLAKEISAKFYVFNVFEDIERLFLFRYFLAVLKTFFILLYERPKVLIVQNPSIVLSFFSSLVKPVFNYILVIDLHTQYIHPIGTKKIIMNYLLNYSLRRGDIIIVTNESYKNTIKDKTNSEIFILPDKIPDFDYEFKRIRLKGKNNILYICTFSEDEPWKEVIKAANLLSNDIYIYISGKNELDNKKVATNVVLTGFLPEKDYQNLVRSVDIIMVLTTQDDCLVCGGYEAVSAEKPMILSNKKVLREYFNKGATFTENNSQDIARSIDLTIKNKTGLKEEIRELKRIREMEWKNKWDNLLEMLNPSDSKMASVIKCPRG